ncbi:alpha/beta-hydrolase [Dendrothele bispora CBS 962.96]|uniref:Carboxylic ester hydrolase n=1 Tax=Dendrothele bispora (strain CBS 962.96) TaxID=1314807 RepID=A0A4S8MRQ0_DENBC|nr:alpha/beta-hydrolase [Dendrothele bispora CBS 962.96]
MPDGTFVGVDDNSTGVTSFKGIPFADAPVGDLRWRAPVSPPSKHFGMINTTKFASSCVSFAQSGSEDCLFGNVFAPAGTTSRDRLPVLVWFHGGGFQSSSTRHADPVWLLQSTAKPFIFVSFAYRLGDMGFLAGSRIKNDGDLNVGLLDQRAGLRWVQRYIGKFGGDRSRVTIWGQSAGAGSTMYHLIARGGNNDGLFHAAMGDSPCNTFTPFATGDYLETLFSQYASYAGCNSDASDVLDCLRSADISVLQSAGTQLSNNRTSTLFNFAPILDGEYVTQRPVEAFSNGRFARVPVFFGSNTDEGAHWSAGLPNPNANTSEPDATEQTAYNFLQGQWDTFSEHSFNRVSRLYPLDAFDDSISLQAQQMYGDMRYICTAGLITGALTSAGLPAFRYHYDNKHLGAFHHYDLQAMFPDEVPDFPPDASDTALFQAMREYWTSFVTDGRPSSNSAGVTWRSVRQASSASPRMLLSPGLVQMEDIDHDSATRCALWESLNEEMQT